MYEKTPFGDDKIALLNVLTPMALTILEGLFVFFFVPSGSKYNGNCRWKETRLIVVRTISLFLGC